MFQFGSPDAFYFMTFVPVIAVLWYFFRYRSSKKLSKTFGGRIGAFLTASVSEKKRFLKLLLQIVAVIFFVIALARPQFGDRTIEVTNTGVELLLLIDVSSSMLAEDIKPNRLEFAKVEIKRFLNLSPSNKVGIIGFAGSAALIAPMTSDQAALEMFVDSLTTETVSSQGTSFQRALSEAKMAFERGGTKEDGFTRATKVILVFSDGEDHEAGALEQAKELVESGIRIFTVAVGTEKGAPIPVRDRNNYLRGYMKDENDQTILSATTGEALRELARMGGGSFYHATIGGNYIRQLAEDIDQLEKADMASGEIVQYDERYQSVLLLGIVLAFIELLISERKKGFRLWRGRYEIPPA